MAVEQEEAGEEGLTSSSGHGGVGSVAAGPAAPLTPFPPPGAHLSLSFEGADKPPVAAAGLERGNSDGGGGGGGGGGDAATAGPAAPQATFPPPGAHLTLSFEGANKPGRSVGPAGAGCSLRLTDAGGAVVPLFEGFWYIPHNPTSNKNLAEYMYV